VRERGDLDDLRDGIIWGKIEIVVMCKEMRGSMKQPNTFWDVIIGRES